MPGALAGLMLAGCSPGGGNAGGAAGTPSPGSLQPTSTLSAGLLPPPTPAANLQALLRRDVTSGSAVAGSFYGRQGQVWIDFSCLGAGTATVSYQPVGSIRVPCHEAAVNATRNQVNFPGNQQVSLKVEAPARVRWAVLVQQ